VSQLTQFPHIDLLILWEASRRYQDVCGNLQLCLLAPKLFIGQLFGSNPNFSVGVEDYTDLAIYGNAQEWCNRS
jgi:hypothetical protein